MWISATVAPHTLRRLDDLAARLDTSRGVIIDLALDALEECSSCHGSGRLDDSSRCDACTGLGVLPRG